MNDVLLEKHLDMLIMLGHVGMLWWVSSTVLCISIINFTLKYNHKKKNLFYTTGISILIGMFFLSIMFYGLVMAKYVLILKDALFTAEYFDVRCYGRNVEPIFSMISNAYLIGTSSFIILLVGWLYVLHSKKIKT